MDNIIEIDGRKLEYYVDQFNDTMIYEEREVTRKKWFLFGETIKVKKDVLLFRFNWNITNPRYTKKEVRKEIEKKLKILKREEEINRGEII